KGFIPAQDKGYLLVNVRLDDSASVQRTQEVVRTMEQKALKTKGVKHTVAIAGQSILLNANAPNFGSMYVMLEPFEDRLKPSRSTEAIAARLQEELREAIGEGSINIFGAPPIDGLGTAGGFKIIVEDRGDAKLEDLEYVAENVVDRGNQTEGLRELFTSFRA